jgi:hypothetical protein
MLDMGYELHSFANLAGAAVGYTAAGGHAREAGLHDSAIQGSPVIILFVRSPDGR